MHLRVVAFLAVLAVLISTSSPAMAQEKGLSQSSQAIIELRERTASPGDVSLISLAGLPAPADPPASADPWVGPIPFDANYFRLSHAKGRAYVPLLGSLIAGSILTSLDDTNDGLDPVGIAGFCTAAAGITIAPSLGLWCTGNARKAWLGAGVRAAGLGGIVLGAWRAVEDTEDEGLGAIVTLPFAIVAYTLPGIVVTGLGARWSLNATPDAFCGAREGVQVSVRPATIVPEIGSPAPGLALRLGW